MHITRIRLKNWRSYEDTELTFTPPSQPKRIVLLGALNGHGKTSLLFALYVGLYGRDGYRYTEGISPNGLDEHSSYRKAIKEFRRNTARPEDPTEIEIEISPSHPDEGVPTIRIKREWRFTSQGQPRQGDAFESWELYENGEIVPTPSHEVTCNHLGLWLFKDEVMPAFFFDGEQAQTLISRSGEEGMSKAVGVLYGTKLVEESAKYLDTFISATEQKFGGRKQADSREEKLNQLIQLKEGMETKLSRIDKDLEAHKSAKAELEEKQKFLQKQSTLSGSERILDARALDDDFADKNRKLKAEQQDFSKTVSTLGLNLALSRCATQMVKILQTDSELEQQDVAAENTITRADEILARSMPEPPESDDLLGNISSTVRERVKERIRRAIEFVLRGPSKDKQSRTFPWLNASQRNEIQQRVLESAHTSALAMKRKIQSLTEVEESVEDLRQKRDRIQNIPVEFQELRKDIEALRIQIEEKIAQIGAISEDRSRIHTELSRLAPEIGKLARDISNLEPEKQKVNVARSAQTAFEDIARQLTRVTAARLESVVTTYFRQIADDRFANGTIRLPTNSSAILERPNQPPATIETMSGFERRAFGISFSLALAQITRKRIPLVIDTPLGNADSAYRIRLLKALSNVDIDQIIILTHDAEVTDDLRQAIQASVLQTSMITFDPAARKSVFQDQMFFTEALQ